jgi:hypothetical protein
MTLALVILTHEFPFEGLDFIHAALAQNVNF